MGSYFFPVKHSTFDRIYTLFKFYKYSKSIFNIQKEIQYIKHGLEIFSSYKFAV